ncbi:MAG: arginine deiminase-related protein [Pseudobdellovibrionaceae bacterium]
MGQTLTSFSRFFSMNIRQSANHLLLIEPAEFYMNPETVETNVYQFDEHESHDTTFHKALAEFRVYRDHLVEHGIQVTTVKGRIGSPDHLFPNWASTHPDGSLVFYPMLNPNRRAERTPEILALLEQTYELKLDIRDEELKGRYLESTGSIVMDHIHKRAYVALSGRTTESLAREWADKMGYELFTFVMRSHTGAPVYHTDLTMLIGTDFAAICADAITDDTARKQVVASLEKDRDVIFLTEEQMKNYCGNSLEVVGASGKRFLVMSAHAQKHLTDAQKVAFGTHVSKIIGTDIPTIEHYGGGSARCLIMELF